MTGLFRNGQMEHTVNIIRKLKILILYQKFYNTYHFRFIFWIYDGWTVFIKHEVLTNAICEHMVAPGDHRHTLISNKLIFLKSLPLDMYKWSSLSSRLLFHPWHTGQTQWFPWSNFQNFVLSQFLKWISSLLTLQNNMICRITYVV